MPHIPDSKSTDQDSSNQSFEAALADLQEVVARLESGSLTLEETIATFGKGSKLAAYCHKMISDAELRVTELANQPEHETVPEQAPVVLPD
jgi:exodeoxyribonuclease VII small subunit